MKAPPRVALFADSFHEVNGAARTCCELERYARRRQLPFLSVHYGPNPGLRRDGSVWVLELKRSVLSVPVDPDLKFDPLFYRHRRRVEGVVRDFAPHLIHVTSPGDAGILGAIVSHTQRLPMIASWHTNLHEFAARRVQKLLSIISPKVRTKAGQAVEGAVLDRLVWFFGKSDVLLAPSPGLVELLRRRTSKLTLPMGRGVDVNLFSPDHRDRRNGPFTIGYVGRLMPEKNVRFLAKLERALEQAGRVDFQFVVTGSGSERQWLEANLKRGRFTGALHGEDLARTYANMDVFVFPSHTDTFGQVVQEAQASGVPPVVTASGGPQFLVVHGVTGLVARDEAAFVQHVLHLMDNPEQRRAMGVEARRQCYLKCWERIFVELYKAYEVCVLMGSSSRLLPPPERATARAPAG